MVKLQKTEHQQRRHSQQVNIPRQSHTLPAGKSGPIEHKTPAGPYPPKTRHSSQSVPPSSWTGPSTPTAFEHSPAPLEPSFVVVGREQFLKRASILAQQKGKVNSSNGSGLDRTRYARSRSASMTSHDSRLSPNISNSYMPSRDFHSTPNTAVQNINGVNDKLDKPASVPNTPLIVGNDASAVISYASKKRSMSLPTKTDRRKGDLSPTKVSFSDVKAVRTYNPDDVTTKSIELPFTPKIDLEMIFDDVTASYNKKLAEAKRRSNQLWNQSTTGEREENRQGVLRKRTNRSDSAPVVVQSTFSIPYEATRPAGKTQVARATQPVATPEQAAADERVSRSLDLSNVELIHPAFRPGRKSVVLKEHIAADALNLGHSDSPSLSEGICVSCGHVSQNTFPLPSTLSTSRRKQSSRLKRETDGNRNGVERISSSAKQSYGISHKPTPIAIPTLPATTRIVLPTNSSQESVQSSKTLMETSTTEKVSLFKVPNKSEGDFVSTTKKDGWPIRMTNWKGPFAAHSQQSIGTPITSPAQRQDGKSLYPKPSVRLDDHEVHGGPTPIQQSQERVERGRSLRRLTIGHGSHVQRPALEHSQFSRCVTQGDMNAQARECRSPSIYSTDIPSPLSWTQEDIESIASPAVVQLDSMKDDHQDEIVTQILPLPSMRCGTLTISPIVTDSDSSSNHGMVMLTPAIKPPVQATNDDAEPALYSLNISRANRRSQQPVTTIALPIKSNGMLKTTASSIPNLEVRNEQNHDIASPTPLRPAPQSLLQFKNNCRPIDGPPTPILLNSTSDLLSAGAPNDQPSERGRPLRTYDDRSHKPRSRLLYEPQNLSIPTEASQSASQSHGREATQPKSSSRRTPKQERMKYPDIPVRTKANTQASIANISPNQSEERPARSQLPPTSFPQDKAGSQDTSRRRSRSRSSIRNMLQTIGFVSKDGKSHTVSHASSKITHVDCSLNSQNQTTSKSTVAGISNKQHDLGKSRASCSRS